MTTEEIKKELEALKSQPSITIRDALRIMDLEQILYGEL